MNVNDKLTAAARRGAAGRTLPNFGQLPQDKQESLVSHVLGNRALTEEIVRASLQATRPDELEDLLNEMGETSSPDQKLHAGEQAAENMRRDLD